MAFILLFALRLYAAFCVCKTDICEDVKVNAPIQYSGVFRMQFYNNHILAIHIFKYCLLLPEDNSLYRMMWNPWMCKEPMFLIVHFNDNSIADFHDE